MRNKKTSRKNSSRAGRSGNNGNRTDRSGSSTDKSGSSYSGADKRGSSRTDRRSTGDSKGIAQEVKPAIVIAVLVIIIAILAVLIAIVISKSGDKEDGSLVSEATEATESLSEVDEDTEADTDTGSSVDAQTEAETGTETGTDTDTNTENDGEDDDVSGNADESENTASDPAEAEEVTEIEGTDALTLSSVYTSSILNPDSNLDYADNIASLEVTNSSDAYLIRAELTAEMSDGTTVIFRIQDLPAGDTAEIFDTENQTLDSDAVCTSLVCTSEEYLDGEVLMADSIEIEASGSDAIITNTSGRTLKKLTVVYHCNMAGQYFGGTSYTITIDKLTAGESYTLSDATLMGEVAVVRIYQ